MFRLMIVTWMFIFLSAFYAVVASGMAAAILGL